MVDGVIAALLQPEFRLKELLCLIRLMFVGL